jgi:hypothetical protein
MNDTVTSSATTSPSFPTLESYVQDTLQKIQAKDPSLTKLVLDDFHFPHVDWNPDGSLDSLTMIRMMKVAQEAIEIDGADSRPSPLTELELRFVDLSEPEVHHALLHLLQAKRDDPWKSVAFVGCDASHVAWKMVLSSTIVTCCQELTLNHNSLPKVAFESLGNALRTHVDPDDSFKPRLVSLHIQRETIHGDKAKALFGSNTLNERMSANCAMVRLQELILNFCRLDVVATQILSRQYLRRYSQNLQILNLGACYLQDHQMFSVLNALIPESSQNQLHTLILTLNHCHTEGCMALKELLQSPCCQLRHLNLSHQKLPSGKIFMPALADGLAANKTLQTLNLSRNRMNRDDVQLLMWSLQRRHDQGLCPLTDLSLMSNPLGRKGLAHVALSLPYALQGLQRLDMLNTGDEDDEDAEENIDGSISSDIDDISLSFEMTEAMENLPLALIHGLHYNTGLELFGFAQIDWLSTPLQLKKSAVSMPKRNSCGSLLSCGSSSSMYDTIPDIVQRRSESQLLRLVPYYLALNTGGRKLLASTKDKTSLRVPLGLWPHVLERAEKSAFRYKETPTFSFSTETNSPVPDVVFHLLRQGDMLLHR